jgi:glutamate-1-semialdehyde aminotransferase
MLKRGVYLVPSHYEAEYTSMAHINANLASFRVAIAPLI